MGEPEKNSVAFCTVLTRSHLEYGLVLLDSAKKHHPEADFFILVVDFDQSIDSVVKSEGMCNFLSLDSISILQKNDFLFQYTAFEACNALKSFLLRHLRNVHGYSRILYLDSDTLIYNRLDTILEQLNSCGILLTPHISSGTLNHESESNSDIFLEFGAYNAGVLGIGRLPSSNNFIDWWCKKMKSNCLDDRSRGLYVDQKYLDLVPGLFDDVFICKNIGLNVGYFNIGNRKIDFSSGFWFIERQPLLLFHFTQYQPVSRQFPSQIISEHTIALLGDFRTLLNNYSDALSARHIGNRPDYTFSQHCNGHKIPPWVRRLHGKKVRDNIFSEELPQNPFADPRYGELIIEWESKERRAQLFRNIKQRLQWFPRTLKHMFRHLVFR